MEGKDVVVTGGAGFIGSHLVEELAEGNSVKVIDDFSAGKEEWVPEEVKVERVDVRDYKALEKAVDEPDVIFHLAASCHTRKTSAGWDDPVFDAEVNAIGTLNVLELVRREELGSRVLFASSAGIYGNPQYAPMDEEHPKNPISPYGVHKFAGEKHVESFVEEQGLDASSVRIFNVFGPRQPRYVMYDFLKKLQDDPTELEVLGSGRQTRDYCYIDDAVQGLITAAENGEPGEAYNMSGENVISIGDLAELMVEMVDVDADIHYTEESWSGDIKRLEADISKLKSIGFEPEVGLREGLENFIEYFEETEGEIS
ncbi:MAG: NAD-dependent epimerase/dehydratase family protein [Candidatus Nanohaloarchaea archaeon]